MKMGDFHCEVLELSFRLPAEEMDKDAFFGRYGKTEGNELALLINSKESDKQHAHIYTRFRSKKRVEVRITFHNSKGDTDEHDDTPLVMEDCVQWLGAFIKPKKVTAGMNAFYIFDKTFTSRMRLPFPLKTSEEALAGCSVVGLSVQFPEGSLIENVIVQHSKDETAISAILHKEITFKKFDLYKQLKEFETPIIALVKKRKKGHGEKRSTK